MAVSVSVVSARETDHGRSGQLYHVSIDGGLTAETNGSKSDVSGIRRRRVEFGVYVVSCRLQRFVWWNVRLERATKVDRHLR